MSVDTRRKQKVVLIGPPSSGKTSITNRVIQDVFSASTDATIGAAFLTRVFQIDGTELRLDIWDTGGSEKFRSLAPMYYRDAQAAIIVFDLTARQSMAQALEWMDEVTQQGRPDILFFGAANKSDLLANREITPEEVVSFAQTHRFKSVREVSAKTGDGVGPLFTEVCRELLKCPVPKSQHLLIAQPEPEPDSCKC
jgi:Ras-related protein Rab-5C